MEIPVISRISGFESEINRLQNHPSLFSRLINQSGIGEIFQIYGVWTLGALILAFLATFSTLIRRTKLLIFRFRKPKLVNSQQLLHSSSSITTETDDDDDDDDETDDETCSAASSDSTSSLDQQDDFTVKGGGGSSLSNNFSWKDFVNGKGVVKSWDGLALGFGGSSGGNLLSLSDFGNGVRVGGRCQFPVGSMPSPSVFVSAGFENSKKVALKLKIWDTRTGRQIPEIFAERQPRWQSVCGGGPVVVGDLRKLNSPLEGLTESEGKGTWWDGDAAIVDGDHEQLCGLDWKDGGSVVSRCRNIILSCFSLDKVGNSI